MENENTDRVYFYDYQYWTLEEISKMYLGLTNDKKKLFRDSFAHFTLAEILQRSNYDNRIIQAICDLASEEVDKMKLVGTDCGRPLLGYDKRYRSKFRKLINLTGKLAKDEASMMNRFNSGEWFLNNLVCLTIGSSFEKEEVDDLCIINCSSLAEDECFAISENFVRYMRGEEIVFHNVYKKMKKI